LGNNDFNVPRERRDTFQGMFESFLDGFSKLVSPDTEALEQVTEAEVEKPVAPAPKSGKQEIHVHVHTEGSVKETKEK